MSKDKAGLIFTDPPYSVNYTGGAVGKDRLQQQGHWDDMSESSYLQLLSDSLGNAHKFSDGKTALYVWFASTKIETVINELKEYFGV